MRKLFRRLSRTRPDRRPTPKPTPFRPAIELLETLALPTANAFLQTNLVSDVPGMAAFTDPQLVNPWGLSASGNSDVWVSDNQTGLSTLYKSWSAG